MLSGNKLAGSASDYEKPDNDFYATDPRTVRLFLGRLLVDQLGLPDGDWWECACGNGNIAEVVRDFLQDGKIYASDIVDRGYRHNFKVQDFLTCTEPPSDKVEVIITNPPFSLLNDFIKKGLELTGRYLILFAKIQTLETKARADIFKQNPPRWVYVHTERQSVWRNGQDRDPNGKKWATTMCMAWFVFDTHWHGTTELRFI